MTKNCVLIFASAILALGSNATAQNGPPKLRIQTTTATTLREAQERVQEAEIGRIRAEADTKVARAEAAKATAEAAVKIAKAEAEAKVARAEAEAAKAVLEAKVAKAETEVQAKADAKIAAAQFATANQATTLERERRVATETQNATLKAGSDKDFNVRGGFCFLCFTAEGRNGKGKEAKTSSQ
jgi:membrane protein involved in colicin uptake